MNQTSQTLSPGLPASCYMNITDVPPPPPPPPQFHAAQKSPFLTLLSPSIDISVINTH